MKSYPLIMSEPEVWATLKGNKTRISLLPTMANSLLDGGPVNRKVWAGLDWKRASKALGGSFFIRRPHDFLGHKRYTLYRISCRYQPGDRLWVRESWWAVEREGMGIGNQFVIFDDEWVGQSPALPNESAPYRQGGGKKYRYGRHSPIHMPRWASRLTLEIISTGAEFVQDISSGDVRDEGISLTKFDFPTAGVTTDLLRFGRFGAHWDTRHPDRPFAENPPCWPVMFKVVG